MLIKPMAGQPANIKVVGVGGGGSNAIASMIAEGGIAGVEFVSVNTDAQALLYNKAHTKVQIGDLKTRGLGSGGDPEVGRMAAEESADKIRDELTGADLVFITAGMGGGTGTGASPVVARIAKETGALTVAIVTKPFTFEGTKRAQAAKIGINAIKEFVDTLIVVPNQKILQVVDAKTPMLEALKKIDSVLHQGVRGVAELITVPGLINVDFADIKTVMTNSGTAIMGIGVASGENRAMEAVQLAISSPLLDTSIDGARGVLMNIMGGPDMTMAEVDEAASMVSKSIDPNADIIFGAGIRDDLLDHIKVTLIATKFDERMSILRFRQDYEKQGNNISSFSSSSKPKTEQKTSKPAPVEDKPPNDKGDDDDDPFEIPAFLRRK